MGEWYCTWILSPKRKKKLSLKERGRERALGQIQLTVLHSGLRIICLGYQLGWNPGVLSFLCSFSNSAGRPHLHDRHCSVLRTQQWTGQTEWPPWGASILEGEADIMNKKGDWQTVKNRIKKKKSGQTRRDKRGVALLVLSGQGLFSDKIAVEQRPEGSTWAGG